MTQVLVEELPMKSFRFTFPNDDIYDIFVPPTGDIESDVVCIMKNGEFLPFSEWDMILGLKIWGELV